MSKTIRVEKEVYDRLNKIRDWKETFSEVIERLLKVYETIHGMSEILGPAHYLKERPPTDAREEAAAHRR